MRIQIFIMDEYDRTLINRQYAIRDGTVPDLQKEIEDMVDVAVEAEAEMNKEQITI